jgi:2-haloacid dehalogenase
LIKRMGNDVLGVGPQPQIVGADLDDVANRLIAHSNLFLISVPSG